MLGMDLVGPLRVTHSGNRYITVLTDYLTKWPEVKAIPSKDVEQIVDFDVETVPPLNTRGDPYRQWVGVL